MPIKQCRFPLAIQYPDLDRLSPMPPIPDGFRLRTWRNEDQDPVSLLMADAFGDPSMEVYPDQLGIFHALPGVEPEGCFVLETLAGFPVATAIGRINPEHPTVGRLHQVGTRKAYWRRGLGTLTVLQAMHHIAAQGGTACAIQGIEFSPMLFYFSLGFAPVVDEQTMLKLGIPPVSPWETAQIWREMFQFLAQISPTEQHILDRCSPTPPSDFEPPATYSEPYVWHDDFLVDDEDDLWEIRATIDGRDLRFAGRLMRPETFVEDLLAYPADKETPIFLALPQREDEQAAEKLREMLLAAGYAFTGIVDPRPILTTIYG